MLNEQREMSKEISWPECAKEVAVSVYTHDTMCDDHKAICLRAMACQQGDRLSERLFIGNHTGLAHRLR